MTPHEALQQLVKYLKNVEAWLGKAEESAKARSFDVEVLATARLAPDQFTLVQQIQAACDQAKNVAAYLSGATAPSHPDTEKTFPELRERLRKCAAYVASVKEADLAGAADRKVAPPWLRGRWLTGHDYLVEMAIPNFFFHVATAYAILRHNGVPLGKPDFIGGLTVREG
jgi:uncharacterized protein